MPWHKVAQGEWIAQIAHQHGFPDAAAIHDHPENAEVKKKRPDPNLLLPGDRLFIPERTAKHVTAQTGREHCFHVRVPTTKLKIIVHDEDDEPLRSKPYTLTVGRAVHKGTSGTDGLIEVAIPINKEGTGGLEIDGHVFPIRVGHLDPLDEVSGVQARLHNLGYDGGPIDGDMNEALAAALAFFQKGMGLEATGKINDATRDKLKKRHGS